MKENSIIAGLKLLISFLSRKEAYLCTSCQGVSVSTEGDWCAGCWHADREAERELDRILSDIPDCDPAVYECEDCGAEHYGPSRYCGWCMLAQKEEGKEVL